MKKINSIHFGGKLLAVGMGLMIIVLGASWMLTKRIPWFAYIPGAAVLSALLIILGIEAVQDKGRVPHYEKHLKEDIRFDPARHEPVIRSSICTGEKVAGWKDRQSGHFTEVMVIKSEEDRQRFMKIYGITQIKTEY